MPDPIAASLADHLLALGAVAFSPEEPFTWASGLRAPLYCDNRLTISSPPARAAVADGFEALVRTHALAPDVVAGTATAGIPHAAWLAERLDLPMVYVRSKPKGHGTGRQVEGRLERGQRVVLVEDLVSTGGSSLAAVRALHDEGAEVAAVLAIFTYGLPAARTAFADAGVPLLPLVTLDDLLEGAAARGTLGADGRAALAAWRDDPAAWSARFD